MLCGECKKDIAEKLNAFLKQHQERRDVELAAVVPGEDAVDLTVDDGFAQSWLKRLNC